MIDNQFSKKFAMLRKRSGITQAALGKMLGVSNRAVSKWETGLALPSTENIYKLSKIFGVAVDSFFVAPTQAAVSDAPTGMQSLKSLYRIGRGPSVSHTVGPERAGVIFREKFAAADSFLAVLYGSLAKTGAGHGTDRVIRAVFAPKPCEIRFDRTSADLPHPNTVDLFAFSAKTQIGHSRVTIDGNGDITMDGQPVDADAIVYPISSFEHIASVCREQKIRLWQYVEQTEEGIMEYLSLVWHEMKRSIADGLADEGILPGGLEVQKRAKQLFARHHIDESAETRENRMVCAYAFAISEQNACAERIVAAPSCCASGVLPSVLYYQQQKRGYSDTEIVHALAAGGIIGNLVRTNASISGSECGCQAEIGTACAMAAAALGELFSLDLDVIEYAAEIAIEHHLGLTCDPIGGLVQIPCIERNAVAAMRAINAVNLASFLYDSRKISLDKVISVMKETGLDIAGKYKETAEGGLAKLKVGRGR